MLIKYKIIKICVVLSSKNTNVSTKHAVKCPKLVWKQTKGLTVTSITVKYIVLWFIILYYTNIKNFMS